MSIVVFGYIRQIENLLLHDKNQNHVIIPDVIFNLIALFYYGSMRFNTNKSGDNLFFINDTNVKKVDQDWPYSICTFGPVVYASEFNQCKIEIKWKKSVFGFSMGFVTSNNMKEELCVKDWNANLGNADNKYCSVGIYIMRGGNSFYFYNRTTFCEKLYPPIQCKFKENDIFTASFNFKNSKIMISHNGKLQHTVDYFPTKRIIPAIALQEIDEEIEIVNCLLT